jgi:hypothetical protein
VKKILLCLLIAWPRGVWADEASTKESKPSRAQVVDGYAYNPPRPFAFITHIPGDTVDAWKMSFNKDSVIPLAVIGVTTGLLIWKDQRVLDKTHELGTQWGIPHTSTGKDLIKTKVPFCKKMPAIRLPYDLGSGLYFLGDGTLHLVVAAGFLTTGFVASDNRALQTSSEIAESYLANGIAVQVIKHVTGHEDPNKRTRPGGRWEFFPSPAKYQKNVPHYDAFPSGHLSSAMVVVTVIAENYSEYHFIWPAGWVLITALSFQMVNNGVHWAGDYPLAIGMGYVFGKAAVNRGRKAQPQTASAWSVEPLLLNDGAGVQLTRRFGGAKKKSLQ